MAVQQPAHFFDRVPAKDAGAAGIRRAYTFQDDITGRIFFANTAVVAGATRVYLQPRDDAGRVSFDTEADGARTATLYGDTLILL